MSGRGRSERHPEAEALQRFAERGAGADPGALRAHLRTCDRCRREVAEIRALRRATAGLPREIDPPRDLWPEVEARVRAGGEARVRAGPEAGHGAAGRPLTLRRAAPWLAAAAALLVAVTAGTTLWLTDGPSAASDGPVAAVDGPSGLAGGTAARPAGLTHVEAGYAPAVERLSALLEAREGELPPATRAALERNLEVVDAAIAEAESALVNEPSSPERVRALDRSYQRKVEMLQRSVRLTSQL